MLSLIIQSMINEQSEGWSPTPPNHVARAVWSLNFKQGLSSTYVGFWRGLLKHKTVLWYCLPLPLQRQSLYFHTLFFFQNPSKHPTFSCLTESWASFPVNNLGEILPKHFLITYFLCLKRVIDVVSNLCS